MSKINLEKMDFVTLRDLRSNLESQIRVREVEESKAMVEKWSAEAREAGFDLGSVLQMAGHAVAKSVRKNGGATKVRKSGGRRYIDPETNVEWAGRGRRPKNFSADRMKEVIA